MASLLIMARPVERTLSAFYNLLGLFDRYSCLLSPPLEPRRIHWPSEEDSMTLASFVFNAVMLGIIVLILFKGGRA